MKTDSQTTNLLTFLDDFTISNDLTLQERETFELVRDALVAGGQMHLSLKDFTEVEGNVTKIVDGENARNAVTAWEKVYG